MKRLFLLLISCFPNLLTVLVYRMLGCKMGRKVRIGFGSYVSGRVVHIGDFVSIGHLTRIECDSIVLSERSQIGHFVGVVLHRLVLGPRASVGGNVRLAGNRKEPESQVSLGMRAQVFRNCFINAERPVHLGQGTGLGGNSCIFTHGSWLAQTSGYPVKFGPVTIGDHVWLPWECFVLPDVTIGSGAVVGARALINRDIPSGALAVGSPAKVIKEQASTPKTRAEQIDILVAITRRFAAYEQASLETETDENGVRLTLNQDAFLFFAETSNRLSDGSLNVVFDHSCSEDEFIKRPLFSLTDFRSSPEVLLSETNVRWFEYVSQIGIRFYPVDELQRWKTSN